MKPNGAKSRQRLAKQESAKGGNTATLSLLPIEIQIGDGFTDNEFEWEVVAHSAARHGAKSLRDTRSPF